MTDGPGPMHQYVRKHKPRVLPHLPAPVHTIAPIPRAVVGSRTAARLELQHARSDEARSEPSSELPLLPSIRAVQTASSSRPSSSSNVPLSTGATKPRKRFRKKVNGLFGDQTDLKKRMDKLLRKTDASEIVFSADAADSDVVTRHRESAQSLPAAKSIIDHLAAASPSPQPQDTESTHAVTPTDSFDFVELTETANKMLGSPEKFANLRKIMGKLSPRSNERFLEELDLGRPSRSLKKNELDKRPENVTPPVLPLVNEYKSDKNRADEVLALSPVSVERTGAPAVLRRKARRLDRGYRCADVLRARLRGGISREALALPLGRKSDSVRTNGDPMNIVCATNLVKMKTSGRRSTEHSLTETVDGDDSGCVQVRERRRYRTRKRKRIIRDGVDADVVVSMTKADEVSLLEMYDSEENESEGRMKPQNPLKMLVEAATGPVAIFSNRSREDDGEESERKRRKRSSSDAIEGRDS